MCKPTRSVRRTALPLLLALAPTLAAAQATDAAPNAESPKARPTQGFDRIFLGFIEDATIVDRQWWEAQGEYSEGDVVDVWVIRGVAVFQPWKQVEIGGRIGYGETSTRLPPDGRGATDLEAWAKYYLGNPEGRVDIAVGALATIPTGDDTAGLGVDAFALGFFGSMRYRFPRVVVSANAGFQINEDGTFRGANLDGETSARLNAAAIITLSDRLNVVGEGLYQSERFDNTDDDARLLAGINWRLGNRGLLRGAVAGGVADGAPDWQVLVAYAVQLP